MRMSPKRAGGRPTKKRMAHPCKCGSGNYCRRHLRYGIPLVERHRLEAADPDFSANQSCGGGQRIIRKG